MFRFTSCYFDRLFDEFVLQNPLEPRDCRSQRVYHYEDTIFVEDPASRLPNNLQRARPSARIETVGVYMHTQRWLTGAKLTLAERHPLLTRDGRLTRSSSVCPTRPGFLSVYPCLLLSLSRVDPLTMSVPPLLQHLYQLDTSSVDFPRHLHCLIKDDDEKQSLSSLQGLELIRLVDFLDKVGILSSGPLSNLRVTRVA